MYWTLQNLKDSENQQYILHYSSILGAATVHHDAEHYCFVLCLCQVPLATLAVWHLSCALAAAGEMQTIAIPRATMHVKTSVATSIQLNSSNAECQNFLVEESQRASNHQKH
jgi:hypothetical protein